jgi:hypothetical protein
MNQFSRLATLSKVLYDKEMIDMRNEMEQLKLKLFWTNHHIENVQECLKLLNRWKCQCNCLDCRVLLYDERPDILKVYDDECTFIPFIEKTMKDLGMNFTMVHARYYMESDEPYDPEQEQLDYENAHLIVGSWKCQRSYGPKLFKATHVNDPELLKLKAFFDLAKPHSIKTREDVLSTDDYYSTAIY